MLQAFTKKSVLFDSDSWNWNYYLNIYVFFQIKVSEASIKLLLKLPWFNRGNKQRGLYWQGCGLTLIHWQRQQTVFHSCLYHWNVLFLSCRQIKETWRGGGKTCKIEWNYIRFSWQSLLCKLHSYSLKWTPWWTVPFNFFSHTSQPSDRPSPIYLIQSRSHWMLFICLFIYFQRM